MKVLMLVITARTAGMIKPQQMTSLVQNGRMAAVMVWQNHQQVPPNVEISGELYEVDIDGLGIKKIAMPMIEFKGGSDASIQN